MNLGRSQIFLYTLLQLLPWQGAILVQCINNHLARPLVLACCCPVLWSLYKYITDQIRYSLCVVGIPAICTTAKSLWGLANAFPVAFIILNISAAIKMLLALTVGVLGIVYVARSGFVNDMAPRTFLPGFDLHSLSYISVIIFNFLGFEVVCTYADNMRDPKRQIPQAIVSGGIVIALIYLFSAFGIGAAIPTQEISEDSGLIDAVALMTGRTSGWFVGAVALLFLITLFGNMISWSMGVNATAAYAAARGDMPAVFSRRWAKNDMPAGAALTSGVVASAVCILGVIIELLSPASSLFWSFFALNLVMLLLSYVPVFPAFLRLRARDPDAERPFRVPGGRGLLRVLAYVPMALILISIFFTAVPLSTDSETLSYYLPITVGSLISIAIGEILIAARARRRP